MATNVATKFIMPDGSEVDIMSGGTDKEWTKFMDVTIDSVDVYSCEQEIGFEADEIIIFFYTPAYTNGLSSMRIYGEHGLKRLLVQQNSWGDKTKEKYIRVHIKKNI